MDDLEERLMNVEWRSWQVVCDELRSLKVEINEADALARAITNWGACLVELRLRQAERMKTST